MKCQTNATHPSTRPKIFFGVVCMLVCVVAVLHINSVASAAEAKANISQSALAVSPAIIEPALDPGKPVKFTVQVSNITDSPVPVKGTVRSFTVQSEALEKTDQARLDSSQWFTLDEPDFILQPRQLRVVKGVILPPDNATPGGHYATLYFQPLVPQGTMAPSTVSLSAKVGVLALLIVKGDIKREAQYQNQLTASNIIRHGPASFTFSVRNSGNVHVLATGKLVISDWHRRQVAKIDVPPGIILPNSVKKYELQWPVSDSVGRYRASLEMTYGGGNAQLPRATVTFLVVPWVEMLVIGLGAGIVVWFVIRTRQRWRKAWRTLRGKHIRLSG